MPKSSTAVTIDIDSDLLEWFKAQGNEYEKRMIVALRIYAQAHKDMGFPSAQAAWLNCSQVEGSLHIFKNN